MKSDVDGSGGLNFRETKTLMHRINFNVKDAHLKQLFEQFDEDKSDALHFDQFTNLMKHMLDKKEINDLFDSIVGTPACDQMSAG